MFLWCLGHVRWRLGRVSVVSRSCLGGVLVMFQWCLGLVYVFRWCLGHVSVVSRSCLRV